MQQQSHKVLTFSDNTDGPSTPSNVQARPSSAIVEHQRVFNYMQPRNVSRFNPTNQRKNSTSSKKGKARCKIALYSFFVWTR